MGEAFITRRGGFGGGSGPSASDAILTVTVPTGSAVTMTKSGVTLTPTMWVQAANNTLDCALFVIAPNLFDSVNAWVVTATRGTTDSASNTVIISSNKEYDMTLAYNIFLFNDGAIHADLGAFQNISSVSIVNNAITSVINKNSGNYFAFQNAIVFKNFGSSLHVLISQTDVAQSTTGGLKTRIGAFSSLPVAGTYASNESRVAAGTQYAAAPGTLTELSVDISSLTPGTYYYLAGIAVASFTVSKIWIAP